jgi:hypothetical protein
MKNTVLLLLAQFYFVIAFTNNNITTETSNLLTNNNHVFIENRGQWPQDVLYLTQLNGLNAWITKQGITYDFYELNPFPAHEDDNFKQINQSNTSISGHVVITKQVNYNNIPSCIGLQPIKTKYNYFLGKNKLKQVKNVSLYREVLVKNIHNNIDVRYYFENGKLRYDYIVNPNANPNQLNIIIDGALNINVNENNLTFTTSFGKVTHTDLFVYQLVNGRKIKIQASWKKEKDYITFNIGNYDKSLPLIIDPLIFSTYLGGSNSESANKIKLDNNDNIIVCGSTNSLNYPTTPGAYQTTIGNYTNIFVTKLNPMASSIIYSTFIGGTGNETCYSMAIDNLNNVYISGTTSSTDFPTTNGVVQPLYGGGGYDGFITKLNADGDSLIFSTFLGGNNYETISDIALDNNKNIYIVGSTESNNYPVTLNGYQQTFQGGLNDVIISKISPNGNTLLYSTYLGGTDLESGTGIAVDMLENIYITGYTYSSDFPSTSNALQNNFNGGNVDIFISKINNSGSLTYSSFFGGNNDETSSEIIIDTQNTIYITGGTNSTNFPITSNAYQASLTGVNNDAFILKININSNTILYSTYFGGWQNDYSNHIVLDNSGFLYITGKTASTVFPLSSDALQTNLSGSNDAFVSKMDTLGNLIYSTYLGGNNYDIATCLTLNSLNNIYILGETYSSNFPTTSGVIQSTIGGSKDIFISKIGTCSNSSSYIYETSCSAYTSPSGNYTYTTSGIYNDTILNSKGCDSIITINLTILSPVNVVEYQTACNSYTWIDGNTYNSSTNSPIYIFPNAAANGCDSIITLNLTINNSTSSTINPEVCNNYTSPSGLYNWTTSGNYTDTLQNINGCDSIIYINLTVNTIDTSVNKNQNVLTANQNGGTYQWVDCDNNYSPLTGETNQQLIVNNNGSYAVIISTNNCTDTSSCITVTNTSVNDIKLNKILLHPNPFKNYISLTSLNQKQIKSVVIFDNLGKIIYQDMNINNITNNINTQNWSNGIYLIRITDSANRSFSVKLVKQ